MKSQQNIIELVTRPDFNIIVTIAEFDPKLPRNQGAIGYVEIFPKFQSATSTADNNPHDSGKLCEFLSVLCEICLLGYIPFPDTPLVTEIYAYAE